MAEVLDSNKSALTHKITAVCAAYLDKRGFKPIETEVSVGRMQWGWIADLASFVYPSWSECKLIGLNTDELINPVTAIVEVKITRGDFRKDIRRKFNAENLPAHICYLAYPKGMLSDEEIPARWVGLEVKADGSKLLRRKKKIVPVMDQTAEQIIDLIAAVAIRRDHRTRYRAMKDAMRMYNAEQRESKVRYKASSLLQGLVAWLTDTGFTKDYDNLKDVLVFYGAFSNRKKIRGHLDKEIEKLTAIKKLISGKK